MYQTLLTNRYLTSRVIPLIAVAAVALCVALVIIVVSVMSGFLDMVRTSGRALIGDVVISYPVRGIAYYDRLIDRLEALPEVEAATPVVESWGLLRMPYPHGDGKETEVVQVWGVEPQSLGAVTGYESMLHWREVQYDWQWQRLFEETVQRHWRSLLPELEEAQRAALLDAVPGRADRDDEQRWADVFSVMSGLPEVLRDVLTEEQWQSLLANDPRLIDPDRVLEQGLALESSPGQPPAMVLGMHVSVGNQRQSDGSYMPMGGDGYWWMPSHQVTLTTLPITPEGFINDQPPSRIFQVVNEFMSGVFMIDDKRTMIPLTEAQDLLGMDAAQKVDEDLNVVGDLSPRVTQVFVRGAAGVTPVALRDVVDATFAEFAADLRQDPDVLPDDYPPGKLSGLEIQTWEEQQAQFIGPIEKERELMRTLFSLIYLVCAGLVLAIFWAIVYEKTRDIGILRAIGASRTGISWIFVRYGLVVGVLGAIGGLGLGALVVRNINVIHDMLGDPPMWLGLGLAAVTVLSALLTIMRSWSGRLLPVVLGGVATLILAGFTVGVLALRAAGGTVIWDPAVYYFTEIPNRVDMNTAWLTMIGAVIFSVLGALFPAAKAADTDPVNALRYE